MKGGRTEHVYIISWCSRAAGWGYHLAVPMLWKLNKPSQRRRYGLYSRYFANLRFIISKLFLSRLLPGFWSSKSPDLTSKVKLTIIVHCHSKQNGMRLGFCCQSQRNSWIKSFDQCRMAIKHSFSLRLLLREANITKHCNFGNMYSQSLFSSPLSCIG